MSKCFELLMKSCDAFLGIMQLCRHMQLQNVYKAQNEHYAFLIALKYVRKTQQDPVWFVYKHFLTNSTVLLFDEQGESEVCSHSYSSYRGQCLCVCVYVCVWLQYS